MERKRPEGRQKYVTNNSKGVHRRGEGLGTGPVGNTGKAGGTGGSGGGNRTTRSGGMSPMMLIIVALVVMLGGGGGIFGALNGGSGSGDAGLNAVSGYEETTVVTAKPAATQAPATPKPAASAPAADTSVAAGARDKYTAIRGGGQDTVNIMIYMCGTDLESRSAMATRDLTEMTRAKLSDNVNILVYTGGCTKWNNQIISSQVNQIYQVVSGGLKLLESNMGSDAMTKPSTLSTFIQWCGKNYPADRNELIFWDHGGGSVSGYGYDEKNQRAGSMRLGGIQQALRDGGMKFDFIGFDACLMATVETALMAADHADYLIASEETEPGVGWYYTNWVTALNKNTSISTLELGKMIVDDFVTVCAQKCRGQSTTLSVVDLAELVNTVPSKLKSFASSTSQMLQGQQFQAVSNARSSAREFAASNKIDQVDLVHLAYNLNTSESKALASALVGAVKYNRTSSNMTNAYGLSVYFPYKSTSKVKSATAAFQAIGMDSDYLRCIQQFASMGTAGQTVAGGASSPLGALLGGGSVGSSSNGTQSMDAVMNILGALMGGGRSTEGYIDDSLDLNRAAAFIADNQLDASSLVWVSDESGTPVLRLSEQQWGLVNDLQLNVFVDDGKGYIDLGLDCVYDFTDDGALKGVYDGSWLAIDQQVVAFYYMDSSFDGDSFAINGRVPCLLNGQRAELLVTFDNDHPGGTVTGARTVYDKGETETVAKNFTELSAGDKIDFLCDYYTYDGDYENTYMLGEQMTWTGEETVSNVDISDYETTACYLLTDIYCQEYWTPTMP